MHNGLCASSARDRAHVQQDARPRLAAAALGEGGALRIFLFYDFLQTGTLGLQRPGSRTCSLATSRRMSDGSPSASASSARAVCSLASRLASPSPSACARGAARLPLCPNPNPILQRRAPPDPLVLAGADTRLTSFHRQTNTRLSVHQSYAGAWAHRLQTYKRYAHTHTRTHLA